MLRQAGVDTSRGLPMLDVKRSMGTLLNTVAKQDVAYEHVRGESRD